MNMGGRIRESIFKKGSMIIIIAAGSGGLDTVRVMRCGMINEPGMLE